MSETSFEIYGNPQYELTPTGFRQCLEDILATYETHRTPGFAEGVEKLSLSSPQGSRIEIERVEAGTERKDCFVVDLNMTVIRSLGMAAAAVDFNFGSDGQLRKRETYSDTSGDGFGSVTGHLVKPKQIAEAMNYLHGALVLDIDGNKVMQGGDPARVTI